MMYPLVCDLAVDGIPVTVTCRVLGFSTQAFYKWKRDPVTDREWDDAHLINAAIDVHHDDPAFGYRFVADELAGDGIAVGERRVWRLCSQQQICSVFAKRRGLRHKAGPPVHATLVRCRALLVRWLTVTSKPEVLVIWHRLEAQALISRGQLRMRKCRHDRRGDVRSP